MTGEPVLSINRMNVSYGAIRAVNDVSVTIGAGEAVAIIGSNGAGKSSTLRGLMRLEPATSESVRFYGNAIEGLPTYRLARLGIGYVPEGRELFGALTVEEELLIGCRLVQNSERPALFEHVYELFPRLKERSAQVAGTMSGGEQQMLSIGRILMGKPKILLLDEPSLGLAPVIQDLVYETLNGLRDAGLSMLLVEQNAYRALKLCTRAYVLENGSIVREAPSDTLLSDRSIEAAYLGVGKC